jgi:TATA-binding protein-associated factor
MFRLIPAILAKYTNFPYCLATSRAARSVKCKHKLILTGTPIQNSVNELWAVFDFLMPNFLGSSASFAKDFATPIARSQMPDASAACIAEGFTKLRAIHQKVLPFILRREKEQVLSELPPKNIVTIKVSMSPVQAALYKDLCSDSRVRKSLNLLSESLRTNSSNQMVNNDSMKSLLALRLLCTHPHLVLSEEKANESPGLWYHHSLSGKMLALLQLLREAGIFNEHLHAADYDCSLMYCDDEDSDLEVDTTFIEAASGLGVVPNLLVKENDCKCLIFAQFTKSLDLLEDICIKKLMPSLSYRRLDGRVPTSCRTRIVNEFNNCSEVKVLLLTTRVGGLGTSRKNAFIHTFRSNNYDYSTGLNLTAANMVVFLELDYNPFADLQAMDRAHRIGQSKTVNVYKLVTSNSIEERIIELQERKVATSNAVVNTENSTMFSMGTDRLLDVFSFEEEGGSKETRREFDLDGIIDTCAEDYASLSVEHFVQSLALPA